MAEYVLWCTKCNINYTDDINICECCGNKAYLKKSLIQPEYVPLLEDNQEILEKHCKTIFPSDVIAILPSYKASMIGAREEMDKAKERAKTREKQEESKKRKAAEKQAALAKGNMKMEDKKEVKKVTEPTKKEVPLKPKVRQKRIPILTAEEMKEIFKKK